MGIPKWLVAKALVFLILGLGRTQTRGGTPPPLGRMVDVGGYRVHLYCVGNGSPTVVITGAGYSFDWSLVQPEVAKFTRVCTYDHSGGAWSDAGPMDTCSLRVSEIHSALRNADITASYVLVGHSLGALVSRLYAAKYEDEAAGMVIVDHATGPMVTRINGAPGAPPRPPLSLPPSATKPDPNAGFEKLPEYDYQLHVWANSQPGFSQVMNRNTEMVSECSAEVKAATQNQASPLGDKPFIALSQPATKQLHTQLLALSSNSKQVVAANSGHYVMVDRPDAVIGAIREVVEAVRNHAKLEK
jgi:pimeloyl-ACP methyl ester carboxylesterase